MVELVADLRQHTSVGLSHWDNIPELGVVLPLALLCDEVGVRRLAPHNARCHSLWNIAHIFINTSSSLLPQADLEQTCEGAHVGLIGLPM